MMIASILAAGPKNGVEIMDEIEKMTQGWWRPSPGSVYPVLEQLARDGMIGKREDGRYELSEKAHDDLEYGFGPPFRRPRTIDEMLNEISGFISYFEDLKRSDKSRTAPYTEKIRKLAERLSSLVESRKS